MKMDVRFGTWSVRSSYRAGSLRTIARESAKYKLNLMRIMDRHFHT
jgi:hypothetical protein